jgi:hypothetical protein
MSWHDRKDLFEGDVASHEKAATERTSLFEAVEGPVPVQPSVIFSKVDIVRDTTVTNGLRYWTPMLSSDLKRKVCSAQK